MRESAALLGRRPAVARPHQSRRIRSRLDHSPVATADDPERAGGVLADLASGPDAERVYASDPSIYGLFRDTATEHLSSGGDSSRGGTEHEPGANGNLDASSNSEADGDGGDPVLWDQQPYWTVVRLASANRLGDGDPDAAGLRDTAADVGLRVAREPDRDARDKWGREKNLT